MRIGLYGLPCAGKTFIMDEVKSFEVCAGSKRLLEIDPNFHSLSTEKQNDIRIQFANELKCKDDFIVDGHYSFGDNVVFTEADGDLYDTFIYLYVNTNILKVRMKDSIKNQKYADFDIDNWQMYEVEELRKFCHEHDKDFYVIDNPENGYFKDISTVLKFIDELACGFSCLAFAKECAQKILSKTETVDVISLLDGDKTITTEDSSGKLGYRTHLFDNNFYTGFQSWRHNLEFADFLKLNDIHVDDIEELGMEFNDLVLNKIEGEGFILTSGYYGVWKKLADKLRMPLFYGNQMAAETKYYIAKELQKAGKRVIALGDGMNDYYMIKQADTGYVVTKPDGSLSRSLQNRDMEGVGIVRT